MARSYENCLNEAVAAEKISQKTANKLLKMIADAEKEAAAMGKGPNDAYTFALSKAAERMAEEVGRTKKSIGMEILATQRLMEEASGHRAGLMPGLEAILGESRRGAGGTSTGLVREQRAAYGMGQSILTDFLDQLRSKKFGLTRDRVAPRATIEELYGKSSGVAGAPENAQAWTKFTEWWMQSMADAGVKIRELKDWRVPQQFNTFKVKAMGQDGFVAQMNDLWQSGMLRLRDFKSTADDAILRPGVDDDRVGDIFKEAYDNIATKGNASIEPGAPRNETLADRYNRRRVFEWVSPEAYLRFQDTFGNGSDNLGEMFVRHFHQMTMDLGNARVLTGNPDRVANTLIDFGKSKGLTDGQADYLERLYFNASGKAGEVANVTFANTMQGVRGWLTGAQLHSAVLASLSDFSFLRSTASWNGLSSTKVLSNYVAEIAGGKNSRRVGTQLGLANDTGLRGLRDHFDQVLIENINRPGTLLRGEGLEAASAGLARIGGRAAEFVMRGTGLEYHSNAGRFSLGKLFLAELADEAGKTLDQLPARLGASLQRYGIDAKAWDVLRTRAMSGNRLFMDPAYLGHTGTAAERDVAFRLLGAVDAEMRQGVPEGGVIAKTILQGASRPGTIVGEAVRSIQYKGFALAVTINHGWRAFDNIMGREGYMPRGQYLAALTIEATVLGALSFQLRNIATGKDPERMDTPTFWLKAAALGGVGGMMGDQIKTMVQTQSAADASRLMTPTGGLFVDTAALSGGNIGQVLRGEPTNVGREGTSWLRKYAAPRLWYTNLAIDRLAWDTLQRMNDPGAAGAFNRIEQRARKDTGTSFWWRPGQQEPSRSPNLEAVSP